MNEQNDRGSQLQQHYCCQFSATSVLTAHLRQNHCIILILHQVALTYMYIYVYIQIHIQIHIQIQIQI